jgi:putative DNA primase/helicase
MKKSKAIEISSDNENLLLVNNPRKPKKELISEKPSKQKKLRKRKPPKTLSNSNLVDEPVDQLNDSEIELQEKSLALLLDSVEVVDFSLEKEPKLKQWKNQINKLKKKVFDAEGNPIDEESKEFIEYEKLLNATSITKLKKQEYSVLVIDIFKRIVLYKNLDLKVYHKVIFFYNAKYWQQITHERFTSFLSNVADKMGLSGLLYKHHSFGSDLIKQFTHNNFVQSINDNNRTSINLKNGTFKFLKGIGKLYPHNKTDNLHYVLPFEYLPDATCPLFESYLKYCLPDEEKRMVLQEFLGYIFTPNDICNLEKCLLLYGEGSNGKSVLYRVINAILGKENIASYSITQLTDKTKGEYYLVNLQDKLLNYCSDTKGAFDDTGVFKQIVSGERVTGRHPAGRPIEFVNNTKFIFNVNSLPTTSENVHGFYRRFEIIDFDVTIEEDKKDRQLASKIIDNELPGVFNWILAGLERLLKNKHLTVCKANNRALERFKTKSNHVLDFLTNEGFEVVNNIENGQVFNELYQHYQSWVSENGDRPLNKSSFKERIDGIQLNGKQVFRNEKCNGNKHKINIVKKMKNEKK